MRLKTIEFPCYTVPADTRCFIPEDIELMYRAKLAEEFLEFVLQGTFEARQQLDGDDNRDKPC